MKLVVLCVETDQKAQTDDKYIDKVIRQFYIIDNNIKIAYVHMNGKGNYNKKTVANQIKKWFSGDFDERHVAYCIDIDNQADSAIIEQNKKIEEYCMSLNYDLIWFCRDIEEVFLHKRISKSDKIGESNKFMRVQGMGKATETSLSSKYQVTKSSNLLCILDSCMDRKQSLY